MTDLAGNVTTLDFADSTCVVDTTLPTVTSATIASNNDVTTLAKPTETVTLNFTASEDIEVPTVTFKSGGENITNSVTIDLQIKDNLNSNVNKIFVKITYLHHLILVDH